MIYDQSQLHGTGNTLDAERCHENVIWMNSNMVIHVGYSDVHRE